jgi:hypothetical protein
MTLVPYIEHGGEQVYAHPFNARGVQFFGFIVSAKRSELQVHVCDRFLNAPFKRRRFVPLLDQVMVVFNGIAAMNASGPPDDVKGVYTEQEAAAWVPVLDTEERKVYWHIPYILVDNSYALAMGREIYGFPKMLGTFKGVGTGPARPGPMEVWTVVTPEFGAGKPAGLGRLLRLEAVSGKSPGADTELQSLPQLAGEIIRRLGLGANNLAEGASDQAQLLESVLHLDMPMVFMKQFRDSVDPRQACFQSIQTCRTTMTSLHGLRIFGAPYQLLVDTYESHPFRADLGLPAGAVPVDLAFWGLFDFEIGVCRELWRAA